ncbi:hypothetical protein OsI_09901 [Oryza sativa Indica Group]|uniref:Uncharacterized protein n=1 Tax=Oryza sativa subsp. indica TaxID=39946 RepID=B8AMX0_ORYSI|nr:hypothetical protein OsI_09901 [Oryza sativa Indica Group]
MKVEICLLLLSIVLVAQYSDSDMATKVVAEYDGGPLDSATRHRVRLWPLHFPGMRVCVLS